MMSNILALIPARGGSKGIPGKNIMEIAGKPLIAYSILQAIKSKHIDRIIVSTDDKEIANISKKWGAEVPFLRPPEFAQDMSPDIEVFRHTLRWLEKEENYKPQLIIHLRPTGPVRKIELIDMAIEKIMQHPEADALRSVSLSLQTPYKMWEIEENEMMKPLLKIEHILDCQSLPRQALPTVYWQNGYVDIIRPRSILEYHSMWGRKVLPFVIEEQMMELDYPENIPAIEKALKNEEKGNIKEISEKIPRHSV
ncbi:MAG: acylneuraminate cytidylyltransferase family protein [Bacteroidetes bacterium]|nr:acylneuraminate cytidylyltransferase family protein [Bacteroidota bacterium]